MSKKDLEKVYSENLKTQRTDRAWNKPGSTDSKSSRQRKHSPAQAFVLPGSAKPKEKRYVETSTTKSQYVSAGNTLNPGRDPVGNNMPQKAVQRESKKKGELKQESFLEKDTRRSTSSTKRYERTEFGTSAKIPLNIPPSEGTKTCTDNNDSKKQFNDGKTKGSQKVSTTSSARDQRRGSGVNFSSVENCDNTSFRQTDKHVSQYMKTSQRSCVTGETSIKESMKGRKPETDTLPPKTTQPKDSKKYVNNSYIRTNGRINEPIASCKVSKHSSIRDPCKESVEAFEPSGTYKNRTSSRMEKRVNEHFQSSPPPSGDLQTVHECKTQISNDAIEKAIPLNNRLLEEMSWNTLSWNTLLNTPDLAQTSNIADSKTTPIDSKNRKREIVPSIGVEVYKNTPLNRRLNRVGKPKGSAVFSAKTKSLTVQLYKDTSLNRKLERVGQPRGSKPVQKKSSATRKIPEMLQKLQNKEKLSKSEKTENKDTEYFPVKTVHECKTQISNDALEKAVLLNNRLLEEMSWKRLSLAPPKTVPDILKDYTGKKILYSELKLHRAIGKGGFGVVYFAKWKDSVVAVKELHAERTSQRKIDDFSQEVMKFCTLEHHNIVKFIGACVELPNMCIVMEYMQMSIFDLLHVRQDLDLEDEEKLDIIQQVCKGMMYLHSKRIAHCDLKPPNILIDFVPDEICDVKLTDFGLSMIKDDAVTSTAGSQQLVRNIGTPRYSAPEILRGEFLSAKDMMKTDIYSLGLVCFEVIYEEEPFAEFTYDQMKKQVGHQREVMRLPEKDIDENVRDIIVRSWSFRPDDRPKIDHFCHTFSGCQYIFTDNRDRLV